MGGALAAAARRLGPSDPNDLLCVLALVVAASALVTQYGYLDRRERGL